MKRFFLFCLLAIPSVVALAYDFEEDGLYYNILDDSVSVEVTWGGERGVDDMLSYRGRITVPATITHGETTYTVVGIGESAFMGCQNILSMTLPDGLQYIGETGFANTSLMSITIPQSVTKIGGYAFEGNKNLSTITLAEGLTEIGDYAFDSCTALTAIVIPSSVTHIGERAFDYCLALNDITLNEGLTSIGAYAFQQCGNKTDINGADDKNDSRYSEKDYWSITIPSTVTEWGEYSFLNCAALREIILTDGLTTLGGRGIFEMDVISSIKEITIPASIVNIGEYAFSGCYNLSEVTFDEGSQLTNIPEGMFADCESLTSIDLPNTITSIGKAAFSGCNLSTIDFPEGLTYIGDKAFGYNLDLTNIVFPDGLEYIGDNAFQYCMYDDGTNASITIPESVTYLGSEAFFYCYHLTEANILANIKYIYANTFSYCSNLATVFIPKAVLSIGNQVFYACSKLEEITCLSRDVPICGTSVFNSVPTSTCMLYVRDTLVENYQKIDPWRNFTNIVGIEVEDDDEGEEIKFVEDGVYYFIPNFDADAWTVEATYKDTAFDYYSGSVTIPATVIHNEQEYTVIGIGENAFRSSPNLTEVNLPESITYIGDNAFYECTALKEIYLPDGVTEIGESAFHKCTSLREITIPASVTYLGSLVFNYCTLNTVTFEDGNTPLQIAINTFNNQTTTIAALYLGRDLTYDVAAGSVEYSPFNSNTSLKEVTIGATVTTIGSNLFRGTSIEEIYVPETVMTIGDNAFYKCNSLKKATIGANTLGTDCFNSCAVLKEATLLETVTSATSLTPNWFRHCDALEEMTIECPDIGYKWFEHLEGLKKLTLTENVKSIDSTIEYCYSLEAIYVFRPTHPHTEGTCFWSLPTESCVLYVPVGSYQDYATAANWEKFLNIVEMTEFAISTLEATDITDTSATLNGSITAAYDDPITEKGFEYWTGDSEVLKAVVDGDEMIAAITNLAYDTKYTYRAYATMDSGITEYGEEQTFTTAIPDGIDSISLDSENVEGIYSTGGQKLNTIEKGVNIVRYNDGTVKKILIK